MASISFAVLQNSHIGDAFAGSGLGFYGTGFGTSVQVGSYQDRTFVTNGAGTDQGPAALNLKHVSASGAYVQMAENTAALSFINNSEATLVINFDNSTPVKVQNAQLRVYDRSNTDYPATGVVTKVCELVNFAGKTYSDWYSDAGNEIITNAGSGDALWWGAPWPDSVVYPTFYQTSNRPYYQNSVGVKFYNFTQYQANHGSGNPDSRLSGYLSPDNETVGGTGVIVPLLDSPGSGGRFLVPPLGSGLSPKFIQYVKNTTGGQNIFGVTVPKDSGTYLSTSFGGTGYDTRHTWRVGLSASPLSIGSKIQYGLYISLEYL
jgi:hypothetical protein